jgi:16S rRNA (cytidine1402-2'-O)-methyltransferase
MVEGAREVTDAENAEAERLLTILLAELPLKQAVDLAAKITGQKKNAVYQAALAMKNKSG